MISGRNFTKTADFLQKEVPMTNLTKTSDYFYDLPQELIAQEPIEPRDHSRLLFMNKETGELSDKHFYDVVDLLETGGVQSAREILRQQNIVNYLKALHADGAKRDLVAPLWSGDKKRVLNYLNKVLSE